MKLALALTLLLGLAACDSMHEPKTNPPEPTTQPSGPPPPAQP
jgi:hypothetical protein